MQNRSQPRSVYSFNTFGSRPLFRYLLLEHRSEFLKVLGELGLSTDDILHGNRILTAAEQGSIYGLACQLRSQDALIGFRSARLHDIHDSGLPGILARCCGTFREMVELHEKYFFKLDAEGVLSRVSYAPETMSYVFDKLAYAPLAIQEYAVSTTWVAMTSLSAQALDNVIAFEFPGTREEHGFTPSQLNDLEKEFSARLHFSSGRLALTMKIDTLELFIPTVDPSLKLLLERKLRVLTGDVLADDADELRNQVLTAVIELRTGGHVVTLEAVAEYMGIRAETLTYALRANGISFQRIKTIVE